MRSQTSSFEFVRKFSQNRLTHTLTCDISAFSEPNLPPRLESDANNSKMKPTVPAFLAIILCGVLNFYWFQSRQSNPALPPQTPQSRTQADSKASPSIPKQESVSKIEIAVNGIAQKITASPLGHSAIILFVFDENSANPPARANTHIIQEWKGQFSPRIQSLSCKFRIRPPVNSPSA